MIYIFAFLVLHDGAFFDNENPIRHVRQGSEHVELGGHLGAADDRRHRVAVAHRLAERDDVGGDTPGGEAPQPVAGAPVARLDLVSDVEGAGLPDALDDGSA